ncbi:hypothetical protein G5C51_00280 [Streptomyces sp. A7024]|uniref:Uncharacterized protein n=1 Tax=Streptomyces coryli TaxID=1128680 RepID=A0A6G4TQR3_9ACTN|nr:hypothetical protein [Streptomyces coryli]NGN62349.1 hypothetical protein [Streptomyces coryli]
MTSHITVHSDAVLVDVDHLADLSPDERTALAAFLAGHTWGALTEQGFADAAGRCAAAGLPAPALLASGTATPDTYAAAADQFGAPVGACAVLTTDPAAAAAALTAGAITLGLGSAGPAELPVAGGAFPLPSLARLTRHGGSPWGMAFAA